MQVTLAKSGTAGRTAVTASNAKTKTFLKTLTPAVAKKMQALLDMGFKVVSATETDRGMVEVDLAFDNWTQPTKGSGVTAPMDTPLRIGRIPPARKYKLQDLQFDPGFDISKVVSYIEALSDSKVKFGAAAWFRADAFELELTFSARNKASAEASSEVTSAPRRKPKPPREPSAHTVRFAEELLKSMKDDYFVRTVRALVNSREGEKLLFALGSAVGNVLETGDDEGADPDEE